jgi:hypothetical protein
MHTIDDKANGIVLNHNQDWSGEVRIAWYDADERHYDLGPTPPSLRECWCNGHDLIAGRFTLRWHAAISTEPPINVITRAVALAVEGYLRHKMECAVDDLFISRGKL